MSKPSDIATASSAPATGLRRLKFSKDWITRPFFGVTLALIVLAAIFAGTFYLAVVAAVAAVLGAREWHRIVGKSNSSAALALSAATFCLMLAAFVVRLHVAVPLMVLVCGCVFVFALEVLRHGSPLWRAGGVLYLGIPALALVALRDVPHGNWLIVALFVAVWATDTGALVIGNLVGGPRLAPKLSPNKTWSGLFGGIVAAAIVEAIFAVLIGSAVWATALFGAALAVAAHLGDLFESLVKRRFHIKDSGGLIPGHGGVLDRIDSTLAATAALAILVFAFQFDPLFGAHP